MADDQRPRGSCVIDGCPRDPWPLDDGTVPYICRPCTSRLRGMLGDIPDYCDRLAGKSDPGAVELLDEERRWPVKLDGEWMTAVERVRVASLPGALTAGRSRGGPVSGTAEAPVPVDLDALDLLSPARAAAAGVARRGDWWQTPGGDPDQIGHLPVAMELDGYVEALRDHRNKGEGRPDPDTSVLCRWLLDRLDDAAVDWPVIAELFTKVSEMWGVLRGSLGEYDGPEYHKGIPCPRCSMLTLIRKPASDFITCADCPAYLSIPEFEEHVKSMSVEALAAKKRAAAAVKLLRDLHALGWRHHAQIDVEGDGEDRNVFTFHYWRRGGERLYLSAHCGSGPYGPIDYRHVDEEGFGPDGVTVAVDWVATQGVAHLRRLASAAGVLSVPRDNNETRSTR